MQKVVIRSSTNRTNNGGISIIRRLYKQKTIQIMALLGFIFSLIFCYIPMRGIYIAFSDYNILKPVFAGPWAGLKYFKEFLADDSLILA